MPETSKEWFSEWFDSEYYHQLYKNRNDKEAEDFIHRLLLQIGNSTAQTFLDLACGKGRHTTVLSENNNYCVGLDISPNSIAAANAKNLERARFFVHDMRDAFPAKDFDAVFNLFTSFGYFETDKEDEQVLLNIFNSLKNGGFFIQDYLNPEPVMDKLPASHLIEDAGVRFDIKKYHNGASILKEINIVDEGKSYEATFTESVKIITVNQLKSLHQKAGFEIVSVFGDYELAPFIADKSPRTILISRKNVD